jgi:hypothetical protein
MGFATATIASLARFFVPQRIGDISVPSLFKRDQQRFKFVALQAGESAQNARFVFEGMLGKH